MPTKPNKKLIQKFAESLARRNPKHFGMDWYGRSLVGKPRETITAKNRCNTTCCIAGDFILFEGGRGVIEPDSFCYGFYPQKGRKIRDVAEYARRKLGLPNTDLFYDFGICTPKQAAAALLEHIKKPTRTKRK